MNKLQSLLLALTVICCSSCAAALVGGAFYKSSKTKQAKKEFMDNFNKTNIEREKLGLPPLDLCSEKYQFDEGWAMDDPICKKKIEAYEAGDKNALNPSQLSNPQGEGEQKQNH